MSQKRKKNPGHVMLKSFSPEMDMNSCLAGIPNTIFTNLTYLKLSKILYIKRYTKNKTYHVTPVECDKNSEFYWGYVIQKKKHIMKHLLKVTIKK